MQTARSTPGNRRTCSNGAKVASPLTWRGSGSPSFQACSFACASLMNVYACLTNRGTSSTELGSFKLFRTIYVEISDSSTCARRPVGGGKPLCRVSACVPGRGEGGGVQTLLRLRYRHGARVVGIVWRSPHQRAHPSAACQHLHGWHMGDYLPIQNVKRPKDPLLDLLL